MEQTLHSPEIYDYRQYDRIWQRVAPTLEPYPGMRHMTTEMAADSSATVAAVTTGTGPQISVQNTTGTTTGTTTDTSSNGKSLALSGETMPPGTDPNPCCMGTAAVEMLSVLAGFIEEELADRRQFLALSRQAPTWARQRLRDMASDEGEHARKLMAVHYLVTGECYQPSISCDRIYVGRWCPALRERYHAAACNGFNYARAADGTTDPCLSRLLKKLSAEEYRHADLLLCMLERGM